jgi:hypothetical protein
MRLFNTAHEQPALWAGCNCMCASEMLHLRNVLNVSRSNLVLQLTIRVVGRMSFSTMSVRHKAHIMWNWDQLRIFLKGRLIVQFYVVIPRTVDNHITTLSPTKYFSHIFCITVSRWTLLHVSSPYRIIIRDSQQSNTAQKRNSNPRTQ